MTGAFPLLPGVELAAVAAAPGTVLIDFWQQGCAPCRALEPRLERFAQTHRGAFRGFRVDVDAWPEAAARHGVMTIPTLVLIEDGHEIRRLDGLIRDSDLAALIPSAPRMGRG